MTAAATNLDHVIPQAMGGVDAQQATVCSPCNSWLGQNVEAPLLGREGCLLPLASRRGFAKGRLKAFDDNGVGYLWNPRTYAAQLLRPHISPDRSDPDRTQLTAVLPETITGPVELADPAVVIQHPVMRKAIAEHGPRGLQSTVSDPEVTINAHIDGQAALRTDLPRLRQLAAKIALTASALTWGDMFIMSELGDWLRQFLSVNHDPSAGPSFAQRYSVPANDPAFIQELQSKLLREDAAAPLPPVVGFWPAADNTGTWISVRILGLELPDLVAPTPFPIPLVADLSMVVIELTERSGLS